MRVIQKVNNNAAIALDARGRQCVIFGKGVGFPSVPYELEDESVIERCFYEFDSSLVPLMSSLSDESVTASAEIIDLARDELKCKLNQNAVFTLADHLQFAAEHTRRGIVIENPLSAEIAYVYPRETEIGRRGLDVVERALGVRLPDAEVPAIALHVVNAETDVMDGGSIDLVMKSTRIIDRIISIVERCLGGPVDRESYAYTRFVLHLRYLIGRLMGERKTPEPSQGVTSLLPQVRRDFPEATRCAEAITDYLEAEHGWSSSEEELLYLVLHVNQFLTDR